jgi:hypothetical protein
MRENIMRICPRSGEDEEALSVTHKLRKAIDREK